MARVIFALMIRESQSRYGHLKIGYLWVLLEPLLFITVVIYHRIDFHVYLPDQPIATGHESRAVFYYRVDSLLAIPGHPQPYHAGSQIKPSATGESPGADIRPVYREGDV